VIFLLLLISNNKSQTNKMNNLYKIDDENENTKANDGATSKVTFVTNK
jgi:hypothetical protein